MHLQRHTGDSEFKCTQYDKSFQQKVDLKQLEKNHTGLKDHSNVQHVIKVLEDKVNCTCIYKDIQGTVHLNALSVIKVFHKRLN